MRYAIISDLHANVEALTAVLASIGRERVDVLVCLGDVVGYNASPNECVRLVRDLGMRTISGNHDRAAIGAKSARHFGRAARRAIEWTKGTLSVDSAEFIRRLPASMSVDQRFFAVHGALHPEPNDDLHLSTALRIDKSFEVLNSGRFGSRVCFFGHTHRPVAYEHRAAGVRRIPPDHLELVPGLGYLINPGSVGQSRDGDMRAAYAIFDAGAGVVDWRRVDYDMDAVERRNRAAGLLDESLALRTLSRVRAAVRPR